MRAYSKRAYSKDLRLRVLTAVDRGMMMPRREVAQTFGVSVSTVKRYLNLRRETAGVEEAKPIPGPTARKRAALEEGLPAQVSPNPDLLTLEEHCELFEEECGVVAVSTATMSRALKALGLALIKRP